MGNLIESNTAGRAGTIGDSRRLNRPSHGLAALLVCIATVASACGGSSSPGPSGTSNASGVAEAKQLLSTEEQAVSPKPNLPAVNVKVQNKKIFYIACGMSFAFTQEVLVGVNAAAAAAGLPVTVIGDSGGDPSKASPLIDQAISRKADAIMLQCIDPSSVSAALGDAQKAGIPVVSIAALNAGPPPAGIAANASFDYTDINKRLAHWVVADSNGKASVVYVGSSSFSGVNGAAIKAFGDELTRLCPTCKTKQFDSPLPQWQTGLPSLATSAINSDPTVNYVVPVVDAMVLFMKPAIIEAGAQSRVKMASWGASLGDMQAVAKSGDPEVADVGADIQRLGWGAFDEVYRLLAGVKPVDSEEIPLRTFDHTNIKTIDLGQSESTWYGGFDYRTYYKQLWGV